MSSFRAVSCSICFRVYYDKVKLKNHYKKIKELVTKITFSSLISVLSHKFGGKI